MGNGSCPEPVRAFSGLSHQKGELVRRAVGLPRASLGGPRENSEADSGSRQEELANSPTIGTRIWFTLADGVAILRISKSGAVEQDTLLL